MFIRSSHLQNNAQLVRELRQAEEALARAAIARGESPTKDAKGKKRKAGAKDKSKNHDDKNIRRRVYDALNVLMAMDIITKDKKEITWRGLPGSRAREDAEGPDNTRDGMSRRQRVRQLQEEVERRREDVRRKQECLQGECACRVHLFVPCAHHVHIAPQSNFNLTTAICHASSSPQSS